jgi:hypothetical protein
VPRKQRNDDEDQVEDEARVPDDEDGEDGDEPETLDLDEAEEEEDDADDDDEDEEFVEESVEAMESRRVFQAGAEETFEELTPEQLQEVLKERGLDAALTGRLKKILKSVIDKGEVDSWDGAWEAALDRLEEELE